MRSTNCEYCVVEMKWLGVLKVGDVHYLGAQIVYILGVAINYSVCVFVFLSFLFFHSVVEGVQLC